MTLEVNANLYTALQLGFPTDRRAVALETPERTYCWQDIDTLSARVANISGSAPLWVDTFREFQAHSGMVILERYGMSETGMLTFNHHRGL